MNSPQFDHTIFELDPVFIVNGRKKMNEIKLNPHTTHTSSMFEHLLIPFDSHDVSMWVPAKKIMKIVAKRRETVEGSCKEAVHTKKNHTQKEIIMIIKVKVGIIHINNIDGKKSENPFIWGSIKYKNATQPIL